MRLLITLLVLALTACGPGGAWVDDPRNFSRAWNTPCPEGVVVTHSSYWRSWHFTREEVLFFQFRGNQAFRDGFILSNAFVPVDPATGLSSGYCRPAPSWFLPGPPARYRAWSTPPNSTREGSSPFIAEDRDTGTFFIYSCQL